MNFNKLKNGNFNIKKQSCKGLFIKSLAIFIFLKLMNFTTKLSYEKIKFVFLTVHLVSLGYDH